MGDVELFAGREVSLGGGTVVRRVLPNLGRRMVGAWCFVDHYGPDDIAAAAGMDVPPHPHIGLQTVSWLLEGEVHHRDSLGNSQRLTPGQLGLMTAGAGIAHAEHSPVAHSALLHGVQLWVALPDGARGSGPAWEHHPQLPTLTAPGLASTVILGEVEGARSPGTTHSPIVGLEVALDAGSTARLPLDQTFEYAAMAMSGAAEVAGVRVAPGAVLYLEPGRRDLAVRSDLGARLLLLGGEPFSEDIVMWWNFVARSNEEIVAARTAWMDGDGFGAVADAGVPTPAPALPAGRLTPRPAARKR